MSKDVIDLLIANGAALRKAGVRKISCQDFDAEFEPAEPVVEIKTSPTDHPDEDIDPLFDAATFGRRNGVPGLSRRQQEDRADE